MMKVYHSMICNNRQIREACYTIRKCETHRHRSLAVRQSGGSVYRRHFLIGESFQ